jgi:DNA-binding MarR family transcriptional regulator
MSSPKSRPADSDALILLEEFLPYRLSVLANVISRTLAQEYSRRFDLTVGEWRVMAVLARFPGSSANDVAERSAMDKVAVSRSVARLIEAGRLDRETDASDRRRSALHLSDEGARIYRQIVPPALTYEAAILDVLDSSERKALFALLDKLDARVDYLLEKRLADLADSETQF